MNEICWLTLLGSPLHPQSPIKPLSVALCPSSYLHSSKSLEWRCFWPCFCWSCQLHLLETRGTVLALVKDRLQPSLDGVSELKLLCYAVLSAKITNIYLVTSCSIVLGSWTCFCFCCFNATHPETSVCTRPGQENTDRPRSNSAGNVQK